jgi:hypothetical protein
LARLRSARGTFHQKLILLGTLVTFLFQGYIVQTHIHFAPAADVGAVVTSAADLKTNTDAAVVGKQRPSSPIDDPAHCPICQEFLHAGQYVTPAPILALLITVVAVPIAIVRTAPAVTVAVSHSWRGRAPPAA